MSTAPKKPKAPKVQKKVTVPVFNCAKLMKECDINKQSIAAKKTLAAFGLEFASFLTSEAADLCAAGNKQTLQPEHLLEALKTLGFDDYAALFEPLIERFRKYA